MPKIEQTIPGNYVAAHTFKFISPKRTEQFKEPNACNQCHTDKTPGLGPPATIHLAICLPVVRSPVSQTSLACAPRRVCCIK